MEEKIKLQIEEITKALEANKETFDKVNKELERFNKLYNELVQIINTQQFTLNTLNKILNDNSE